jgi:BirA family transcriptional regulator, biotin operon repressor / biotin---[acetyl-CoA-carboxylase] ligase
MLGATFSVEQENFQPFSLNLQPPSSACEKLRYFSDSPNLLTPYHPPFPGAWIEISGEQFQSCPTPLDIWSFMADGWDGRLWEWSPTPVSAPTPVQWTNHVSDQSEIPGRMEWDWLFLTRYAAKSQFDQLRHIPIEGTTSFPSIACLALEGNDFHGSQGRSWRASFGNLHLSTLIAPNCCPKKKWIGSEWIIAASAGIHAGLTATCKNQVAFEIKWMNDVLSRGQKIAGALTATDWTGERLNRLVWGIGLNVHTAPSADSNSLGFSPGCLNDLLLNPNPLKDLPDNLFWESLMNLLNSLARSYNSVWEAGLKDIYAYYINHAAFIGQEIHILDPNTSTVKSGILEEIKADLTLKIKSAQTGLVETCRQGRLLKPNR